MATHSIDITKEHCPMTFVKVKIALSKLAKGDTLDVLLTGGEPLENVPKSAQEQGHVVRDLKQEGEFYRLLIEKN